MLLPSLRLLIATMWAGSLWTIGGVVAPTLFSTLRDRVLAGTIAGGVFQIEAWLSVVFAVMLFVLHLAGPREDALRQKRFLLLVGAMLLCTLAGYFALHPFMAALKDAAGPAGMTGAARTQFGILHAVSSAIYLAQCVLAAALVLMYRPR